MRIITRDGNYFYMQTTIGEHIFIVPLHEIVQGKIIYFK